MTSVNPSLTPADVPRSAASGRVENSSDASMLSRMIRAYGRRVADSDPDDLATMLALRDEFDLAVAAGVRGMRENYGYSWADIGRAAGMTRQAAHEKWGGK